MSVMIWPLPSRIVISGAMILTAPPEAAKVLPSSATGLAFSAATLPSPPAADKKLTLKAKLLPFLPSMPSLASSTSARARTFGRCSPSTRSSKILPSIDRISTSFPCASTTPSPISPPLEISTPPPSAVVRTTESVLLAGCSRKIPPLRVSIVMRSTWTSNASSLAPKDAPEKVNSLPEKLTVLPFLSVALPVNVKPILPMVEVTAPKATSPEFTKVISPVASALKSVAIPVFRIEIAPSDAFKLMSPDARVTNGPILLSLRLLPSKVIPCPAMTDTAPASARISPVVFSEALLPADSKSIETVPVGVIPWRCSIDTLPEVVVALSIKSPAASFLMATSPELVEAVILATSLSCKC